MVKLDPALEGPVAAAAAIGLARALGLQTVAEGVEHPEQLAAPEVHRAQGYLLGQPA